MIQQMIHMRVMKLENVGFEEYNIPQPNFNYTKLILPNI